MTPAHRVAGPRVRLRGLARVLTAVPLVLGTAACSGAVQLDEPPADRATRDACETFLSALPDELEGQEEREVEPADALGRAWGDPAIEVTCGVEMPAEFDRFSPCDEVNGVGWFIPGEEAAEQSEEAEITTIGYQPVVRVVVPPEHRPPAGILVVVGKEVKKTLEKTGSCA